MSPINCEDRAAFWKQVVDKQLLRESSFQQSLKQQQELGVAFNVRLFTARDHDLQPLIDKLEAFLVSYGFNVAIDERAIYSILEDHDSLRDTDLLIIFSLSADLESFCLELSRNQVVASRMIVCIPDGDDGKMYCRLIREQYGVETIKVFGSELPISQKCRCGIELAKHCASYLMAKVADSSRELRIKNTVVVMIPGIRTRALWQRALKQSLESVGLLVCPTNYEKLDVVRFLLPFHWIKETPIRRVKETLRTYLSRFPDADIAIIAHSFGTFITGKLMLNSDYKFGRVAFCGSVLPIDYDFRTASGNFKEIVNEVGYRDIWPVLAAKIGWGYGPTGCFGFNHGLVQDRVHISGDHSSFLTQDFCDKYWLPFFCDGDLICESHGDAKPSLMVRIIDTMPGPIAKIFFWGLVMLLMYKLFLLIWALLW